MFSPPPPKPPPPGSIDFEITDFEHARQVLDDLPAGIIEVKHMQPGFWERQRRKSTPTDRALTGAAMDWVIGLPPGLRPHATCEHFPRVVNALAGAWADSAYSVQVLDHMINDYRGGRRGFPVAVQQELAALLAHQRGRR
ncbi:MAG: hypothetical protein Q8L49_04580 [Burkholderiaceae bacterium]|nr:hypothetical protein [Burkholderiaceae bacterium]